jgi:hypothetical protein
MHSDGNYCVGGKGPERVKVLVCSRLSKIALKVSGERGIRTPGPRERTTVFKTAAFDHSAISPLAQK